MQVIFRTVLTLMLMVSTPVFSSELILGESSLSKARALDKEGEEIQATYWYQRAAESGDIDAQLELGKRLEFGLGTSKDKGKAIYWYKKSASKGSYMAQYNLAVLYEKSKELDLARQWFQLASMNGHTASQSNLAYYYEKGLGVKQDFESSYKWYVVAGREGEMKKIENKLSEQELIRALKGVIEIISAYKTHACR